MDIKTWSVVNSNLATQLTGGIFNVDAALLDLDKLKQKVVDLQRQLQESMILLRKYDALKIAGVDPDLFNITLPREFPGYEGISAKATQSSSSQLDRFTVSMRTRMYFVTSGISPFFISPQIFDYKFNFGPGHYSFTSCTKLDRDSIYRQFEETSINARLKHELSSQELTEVRDHIAKSLTFGYGSHPHNSGYGSPTTNGNVFDDVCIGSGTTFTTDFSDGRVRDRSKLYNCILDAMNWMKTYNTNDAYGYPSVQLDPSNLYKSPTTYLETQKTTIPAITGMSIKDLCLRLVKAVKECDLLLKGYDAVNLVDGWWDKSHFTSDTADFLYNTIPGWNDKDICLLDPLLNSIKNSAGMLYPLEPKDIYLDIAKGRVQATMVGILSNLFNIVDKENIASRLYEKMTRHNNSAAAQMQDRLVYKVFPFTSLLEMRNALFTYLQFSIVLNHTVGSNGDITAFLRSQGMYPVFTACLTYYALADRTSSTMDTTLMNNYIRYLILSQDVLNENMDMDAAQKVFLLNNYFAHDLSMVDNFNARVSRYRDDSTLRNRTGQFVMEITSALNN